MERSFECRSEENGMGMWGFYGRRLEVVGESGRREGRFSQQLDTVGFQNVETNCH